MSDNYEVRIDLVTAWEQGFVMGCKYAPEKPVEATGVPDWEGMHHGVVRKLDTANARIDALVYESVRWEGIAGKNSDRVYELTEELEIANERVRVLDALAEESTERVEELGAERDAWESVYRETDKALQSVREELDTANGHVNAARARNKELRGAEADCARLNENNEVLASSCVALRAERDVWEERARDFVKRIKAAELHGIEVGWAYALQTFAENVAREVKEWDA